MKFGLRFALIAFALAAGGSANLATALALQGRRVHPSSA